MIDAGIEMVRIGIDRLIDSMAYDFLQGSKSRRKVDKWCITRNEMGCVSQ